ncbi:unnamed protein product [Amoebophrya sp. A25]|nr:unnamed protein product [Amoebophrya sp. A25]|eukprot:GSA25T00022576001.1
MENPFSQGGSDPWFQGGFQQGGSSSSFPTHPMAQQQQQPMGAMGQPDTFTGDGGAGGDGELGIENEPPILEELGIDIDAVMQRIKAVALLRPLPQQIVLEGDLTGPGLIVIALMGAMLLQGKIRYEVIYTLVTVSCMVSYLLINLMAQKGGIDLYCVISMFGYGLMPIVLLAFLSAFISFKAYAVVGTVAALVTIAWCTASSSRFVESALDSHDQQYLIAYPTGLLYALFVVVTIF